MIPESPSRITIGKRSRESPTAGAKSPPGVPNSSTIRGAASTNTAVSPVVISRTSQKIVDATRHALARSPFSRSSLKTGTKAPERAVSATSARTRFGIWNATVNALIFPAAPKVYAATISRTSPSTRERPVAAPKTAVDRARRRRCARSSARAGSTFGSNDGSSSDIRGEFRGMVGGPSATLRPRAARSDRGLLRMANIKQQKKRVDIAARQRLENLRYRSTIKTLAKRLQGAVAEGDEASVAARHPQRAR